MGGLVSGISNALGTKNKYNAQAPKDLFEANQANLDTTQYGDAVARARDASVAMAQQPNSAAEDQTAFATALKAQMSGQGPSLAQRQLETATQQNALQTAGTVASLKGINPALAARMILENQAAQNQTAAGQAATLRQSEQLNTEALLAQALQAQRGQDINQQQANTSLTGTLGQLQQGQNENTIRNVLGTQQIQAGVAEGNANRALGAEQINAGVASQNASINGKLAGGLLGAAGSAPSLAEGGEIDFRRGGRVPGRATVPGDSPKNDTVPAVVSPGEIVLPRTVAQAPDAEQKAADFVAAIRAKKKEPTGYGKVLEGQRALAARLARLEKMADGGEVEGSSDPGMLDRLKRWWDAKGEDEKASTGKAVDDKVAQSLPVVSRAREDFRKHNADLEAAFAASGD